MNGGVIRGLGQFGSSGIKFFIKDNILRHFTHEAPGGTFQEGAYNFDQNAITVRPESVLRTADRLCVIADGKLLLIGKGKTGSGTNARGRIIIWTYPNADFNEIPVESTLFSSKNNWNIDSCNKGRSAFLSSNSINGQYLYIDAVTELTAYRLDSEYDANILTVDNYLTESVVRGQFFLVSGNSSLRPGNTPSGNFISTATTRTPYDLPNRHIAHQVMYVRSVGNEHYYLFSINVFISIA
jgi:hypothetical protein